MKMTEKTTTFKTKNAMLRKWSAECWFGYRLDSVCSRMAMMPVPIVTANCGLW